jgi:hypothetical protein
MKYIFKGHVITDEDVSDILSNRDDDMVRDRLREFFRQLWLHAKDGEELKIKAEV